MWWISFHRFLKVFSTQSRLAVSSFLVFLFSRTCKQLHVLLLLEACHLEEVNSVPPLFIFIYFAVLFSFTILFSNEMLTNSLTTAIFATLYSIFVRLFAIVANIVLPATTLSM